MKKTILIGSSSFSRDSLKLLKKLTKNKFNIIANNKKRRLSDSELFKILKSYNVIGAIAGLENYNLLNLSASNLRVISRIGSGLSNIDLKNAKKRKIKIFNTPKAPVSSVAELTISMMIYLLRHIEQTNIQKTKKWNRIIGDNLQDKKILIIGLGNIGKKLFKLLKPFNVKFLIHDVKINKKYLKYYVPLIRGIKEADVITVHVNQDKEIIGRKEMKYAKKTAIFLNSSRGKVINENALYNALIQNKIAGAWVDVFEKEPYKGILAKFSGNLIITPHISSHTVETRKEMENEAIKNLIDGMIVSKEND